MDKKSAVLTECINATGCRISASFVELTSKNSDALTEFI